MQKARYWITEKKVKGDKETWRKVQNELQQNYDSMTGRTPSIVNLVNQVDSPYSNNKYLANCGVVLKITLRSPSSWDGGGDEPKDYLGTMDAVLVDFSKEETALLGFAKDFWAKADAAKQQKLSKDSQIKTQL